MQNSGPQRRSVWPLSNTPVVDLSPQTLERYFHRITFVYGVFTARYDETDIHQEEPGRLEVYQRPPTKSVVVFSTLYPPAIWTLKESGTLAPSMAANLGKSYTLLSALPHR